MKQWKNIALILIVATFAIFLVVICRQIMRTMKVKKIQYNDIDSDSEGEIAHDDAHEEQEIELTTNMKEDVEDTLGAERVQCDSDVSV